MNMASSSFAPSSTLSFLNCVYMSSWFKKLFMLLKKRKPKKKESPALTQDLVFEILSQATLKDIGRCRLVSKAWNLLTYDTSFKQEHSKKTKTISGFFIRGYARKPVSEFVSINALDCDSKLSLDFLPSPVQIEASTKQGILLCVKSSETRILGVPEYFVCKPSTKQWQQIPNPKTWYETKRCAMVVLRSNPLRYKIVRFSEPKFSGIRDNSCYSLWCEIFDSATWAWKKLEDRVRFPEYEFLRLEPAVSVCGSFYWLMTNNQVFAFHEDTESWTILDIPKSLCKNFIYMKLVEYQGNLGMVCKDIDFIQLWVMETKTMKWSERKTVSTGVVEWSTCPTAFYSTDIAVMKGCYSVIFCNFKRCSSNVFNMQSHPIEIHPIEVFPFQSDLEPVILKNTDLEPVRLKNNGQKEYLSIVLCWIFLFSINFFIVFFR